MPWTRIRFRDEEVIACCRPDGTPLPGGDGFVPFMYRAGGKQYKTRPDRLTAIPGAPVVDDFMSLASGAGSKKKAAGAAPKAGGSASRGGAGKAATMRFGNYTDARPEDQCVQVWTDGACSGNPGPAGLGVIVMYRGEVAEMSEYLGIGTNNIAELTAILRGLEMLRGMGVSADVPVDVVTDSSYCIGLLTKGWTAKKNQALVATLREHVAAVDDIRLLKVPGHAGVPLNERADELAREAIALNV